MNYKNAMFVVLMSISGLSFADEVQAPKAGYVDSVKAFFVKGWNSTKDGVAYGCAELKNGAEKAKDFAVTTYNNNPKTVIGSSAALVTLAAAATYFYMTSESEEEAQN